MNLTKARVFFVTGTDTGVGKTLVSGKKSFQPPDIPDLVIFETVVLASGKHFSIPMGVEEKHEESHSRRQQ